MELPPGVPDEPDNAKVRHPESTIRPVAVNPRRSVLLYSELLLDNLKDGALRSRLSFWGDRACPYFNRSELPSFLC